MMLSDLFVLIKERLQKKEPLVLVTVIGSSGSTPRKAGAHMLVGYGTDGEGSRLWGTIGGGLPEYLAIKEAGSLLLTRGTAFRKYLLHPGEAAELGLKCGGELSVFFRCLNSDEPGLLDIIDKGIACFSGGKTMWLIMEVYDDQSDKSSYNGYIEIGTEDELKCFRGLLKGRPGLCESNGKLMFSGPLNEEGFVYVFGGGHVAQELIPLLVHLEFRCVVFDDREEFSRPDLFPGAEKIILGDYKNIGEKIVLGCRDFAVILTRGHLWDLEAWAFALKSSAAYIGVIGSRTKHEFVKGQLRERGFNSEEINAPRVHAPIGMNIKSDTPAEIAVSIAGELILARALLRAGK